MDALKEHYDWIHKLRDALITELREEAGNEFVCDRELIEGAEIHSKAMMDCGEPYDAPPALWKPAVSEMVKRRIAYYQRQEEKDLAIQKEIQKLAEDFFYLKDHSFLRYRSAIIGVGIAVKEIPGQVILYATIRATTTAKFMGVKIDSK